MPHPSSKTVPSSAKMLKLVHSVTLGPTSVWRRVYFKITCGDRWLDHPGRKNTIYPFTSIGGEPQDLKYQNEKTLVTIGSENIIREGVTIHRGTKGGGGETILEITIC